MSKIYISRQAHPAFIKYIENLGHSPVLCGPYTGVDPAIQDHPDLVHCSMGPGMAVFHGNQDEISQPYPKDVPYNACATGKYFIHNLKYTHPDLLQYAIDLGLKPVDVKQGYSRCLCLPVDHNSIITADKGIIQPCRFAGINVLEITPGHVELPGYTYGFIGGAAGRIGNTIYFHGSLNTHPDAESIKGFIKDCGLEWVDASTWLPEEDLSLMDIGSIIEEIDI